MCLVSCSCSWVVSLLVRFPEPVLWQKSGNYRFQYHITEKVSRNFYTLRDIFIETIHPWTVIFSSQPPPPPFQKKKHQQLKTFDDKKVSIPGDAMFYCTCQCPNFNENFWSPSIYRTEGPRSGQTACQCLHLLFCARQRCFPQERHSHTAVWGKGFST